MNMNRRFVFFAQNIDIIAIIKIISISQSGQWKDKYKCGKVSGYLNQIAIFQRTIESKIASYR